MKTGFVNIRTLIVFAAVILLSGCDKEDIEERTPFQKEIYELIGGSGNYAVDMKSFVKDIQKGVWICSGYEVTFEDGTKKSSALSDGNVLLGGTYVDDMLFLPDNTGRMFIWIDAIAPPEDTFYKGMKWSVSAEEPDVIHLVSDEYDTGNGKLKLLYYKDGIFVMSGTQPNDCGIESSLIKGYISYDQDKIDEYLSYPHYSAVNL